MSEESTTGDRPPLGINTRYYAGSDPGDLDGDSTIVSTTTNTHGNEPYYINVDDMPRLNAQSSDGMPNHVMRPTFQVNQDKKYHCMRHGDIDIGIIAFNTESGELICCVECLKSLFEANGCCRVREITEEETENGDFEL